jgi:hypothetical protein
VCGSQHLNARDAGSVEFLSCVCGSQQEFIKQKKSYNKYLAKNWAFTQ